MRISRVLGALLLCGSGAAWAGDRATVSAVGSAETTAPPDFVRLGAHIQERGTKIDDLLKSIGARGVEIGKKLQPLGATSVTIGQPDVIPVPAEGRRQISAALSRLKAIKQGQEGEEVLVQLKITVEYPLSGDQRTQHLAVADLRRKLADAIKQPSKEDDEPSSDDENEAQMLRMATGDIAKPGTVVALYCKRLTDDLLKKTMQEAFTRAEASARLMAEAAGQSLGPLISLGKPNRVEDEQAEGTDYVLRQVIARAGGRRAPVELVSPTLSTLSHRASIMATFELKPK